MRSLVGKSLASRGGAVRRRSTNAEKAKQPPNNLRRELIPGAWATLYACVLSASASASTPAAAERATPAPAAATERGATASAAAPETTAAAAAAPAAASPASAASAAAPAAAAALLREEALHGEQLIRRDVELVALGVARSHDALGHLDREHGRVDGAEDLFNFANLGLVLKEDRAVEVRNLGVRELAHGLTLARVDELANLCRFRMIMGWRGQRGEVIIYFQRGFAGRPPLFACENPIIGGEGIGLWPRRAGRGFEWTRRGLMETTRGDVNAPVTVSGGPSSKPPRPPRPPLPPKPPLPPGERPPNPRPPPLPPMGGRILRV